MTVNVILHQKKQDTCRRIYLKYSDVTFLVSIYKLSLLWDSCRVETCTTGQVTPDKIHTIQRKRKREVLKTATELFNLPYATLSIRVTLVLSSIAK